MKNNKATQAVGSTLGGEIPVYSIADMNEIMTKATQYRSDVTAEFFAKAAQWVKSKFSTYIVEPFAEAVERAQAYDQLARLSDHDLKDIGIQRSNIAHYAYNRPAPDAVHGKVVSFGAHIPANRNDAQDWDRQNAA